MLVRVECLGFQMKAARCYMISQAKLREKSGSPSNQASDQPIPTLVSVNDVDGTRSGLDYYREFPETVECKPHGEE